jgi:small-conductance mechanosensitive channel
VTAALMALQDAIADQKASYETPASLMAQIAQDDPRLRSLIRQLHHRWNDLATTTQGLAEALEVGDIEDAATIADIREQVRWLMTALHHHRAREADLIFEGLRINIAAAS